MKQAMETLAPENWEDRGEHPEDGVVACCHIWMTNDLGHEVIVWSEVEEPTKYGEPGPDNNYAVEFKGLQGLIDGQFVEHRRNAKLKAVKYMEHANRDVEQFEKGLEGASLEHLQELREKLQERHDEIKRQQDEVLDELEEIIKKAEALQASAEALSEESDVILTKLSKVVVRIKVHEIRNEEGQD